MVHIRSVLFHPTTGAILHQVRSRGPHDACSESQSCELIRQRSSVTIHHQFGMVRSVYPQVGLLMAPDVGAQAGVTTTRSLGYPSPKRSSLPFMRKVAASAAETVTVLGVIIILGSLVTGLWDHIATVPHVRNEGRPPILR